MPTATAVAAMARLIACALLRIAAGAATAARLPLPRTPIVLMVLGMTAAPVVISVPIVLTIGLLTR